MSANCMSREILHSLLNIFTSFNITHCKITVRDNSITLDTKEQLTEDFDPNMFVTTLANTTIEITFRKQDLQTLVVICNQKIIRKKIKIVCPDANKETVSISFKLDKVWDVTNGVILEIRNAFPNINIQVELVRSSKAQWSKEKLQYMYQCQRVSASIASILSYSLNAEFRMQCRQLIEPDKYPNLGIQEIIQEKLSNINNNKF